MARAYEGPQLGFYDGAYRSKFDLGEIQIVQGR